MLATYRNNRARMQLFDAVGCQSTAVNDVYISFKRALFRRESCNDIHPEKTGKNKMESNWVFPKWSVSYNTF